MDPLIGAALISGAANIGGGFFSAAGASQVNQQNLAQSNMLNQQMLNAQMATHAQNTAFMEDQQAFNAQQQAIAQTFNADQATIARDWSAGQAADQRKWQTDMSNSAYQRAVADMRAAGLNPMLAYMQGGASTPPGAMGSASAASSSPASSGMASGQGAPSLKAAQLLNDKDAIGRAIGNAVSSAVDTYKVAQGVEVMKADEKLKDEQTRRVGYETSNIDANTQRTLQETNTNKQEERNKQIEELILKANAVTAAQNARTAAADAEASERYGGKYAPGTWERILRSIQGQLESAGQPRPLPKGLF